MVVSNVWVLDGGRGDRWLIDSGHPVERLALVAGLRATGFAPREFSGVLLTHHHSDHAGNADFLRRSFGIPVFAHALDAEVLEAKAPPAKLRDSRGDRGIALFAAIENHTRTRVAVDRALQGGEQLGSLEVHHAPGHTRGSVLFRHAATESLLSGDALLAAVPPWTIEQRMCLPHPDYAASYSDAIDSLRTFCAAGHRFAHLLSGHGAPIRDNARDQALRLLERLPADAAATR